MQIKRKREEPDREIPWKKWRAAIYLREPADEWDIPLNEPSIDQQRALCRCTASVLNAEIVGEFVDKWRTDPSRPGLRQVLDLTLQEPRLDYLIVSSLDRLVSCIDEAFELAWWLGFASTVVIPANGEKGFPWTGTPPPDQE
jgi:hypothetical protein